MRSRPPYEPGSSAPRPGRLVDLFLLVWLVFQIGVPIAVVSNRSDGDYPNGNFSWVMFARTPGLYEASIYALEPDGTRVEIEGIERIEPWGPRLEPRQRISSRYREGRQELHLRKLVDHVAAERADGRVYGVDLRWIELRDPDWPREWSYATRAEVRP